MLTHDCPCGPVYRVTLSPNPALAAQCPITKEARGMDEMLRDIAAVARTFRTDARFRRMLAYYLILGVLVLLLVVRLGYPIW